TGSLYPKVSPLCEPLPWLFGPFAGVGEGDAKAAATLFVALPVIEPCPVALAQLAGDIESQAGSLVFGGEEGFENQLFLLGGYAWAIIEHLRHGQVADGVAKQARPDLRLCMRLAAVAQAVLDEVGQHLDQLVRVHAGLQRAADGFQMQRLVGGEAAAELAG